MLVIRDLLVLSSFLSSLLAVTVIPSTLALPRPYVNKTKPATSNEVLFHNILRTTDKVGIFADGAQDVWRSEGDLYASQDSFVRGFIEAAVQHQHLVIHPEDVWFTILTQMSFWLGRSGKPGDAQANASRAYSWGEFSFAMEKTMENEFRLKDKSNSLDWVKTNLTTTGRNDGIIANALMMFSHIPISKPASEDIDLIGGIGIPSITLSGVQNDWELLVQKLDRLENFGGGQNAAYSHRLRSILKRFVATFQDPNDRDLRDFWDNAIVQRSQSSPDLSDVLTGWLGGFLYWDPAGYTLEHDVHARLREAQMTLDNIMLPWHRLHDLPTAYSSLRMCWMDDRLTSTDVDLVAGMVAKSIKKGKPVGYEAALRAAGLTLPSTVSEIDHSILRPLSLYFAHSRVKVNPTSSVSTPKSETI
jgi:hypothetical protein